jgi:hypothetical protein
MFNDNQGIIEIRSSDWNYGASSWRIPGMAAWQALPYNVNLAVRQKFPMIWFTLSYNYDREARSYAA